VRVVATSQRDLEAGVRSSQFSEDLLALLTVVEIRVPPLRDRREDILPLVRRFLHDFTDGKEPPLELTERAVRALLAYPWEGNIRELRSAIHHAVILSPGTRLDLEALPPKLSTNA
jgi:two-component system response regulator AtoC